MQHKIPIPIQAKDPEFLPVYSTSAASGADVRAAIQEQIVIRPGASAIIPTGVRVDLPAGYEIQVRPRSGFAAKNQVTVLNAPGTIDSDYRGEICVILINHGEEPFIIGPKMKIAQLVLAPVAIADFYLQNYLSTTQRGEGKFGHTGSY
ncbi:MAG TPA: dUTP diphosphatase [Chlamydiales bacterium]|nr:dUTP diphosphatase [Chlamydiales bacterium]